MQCKFCEKLCKSKMSLIQHERVCKQNPDRSISGFDGHKHKRTPKNQHTKALETGIPYVISDETRIKISKSSSARTHTEETKKKISNKMKVAHLDGRAWNIGKSRWNNEPSYPEKFFMQVIENEFLDKNYQSEYPIGIYSADFCWLHLKKVIEIDGEQHYRFPEYIERDKRKDVYLKGLGFEILRISWKEMFNDAKGKIKEAFDFIHK